MNIDKQLEKILQKFLRASVTEGNGRPLVRRGIREETIKNILRLFQSQRQQDYKEFMEMINKTSYQEETLGGLPYQVVDVEELKAKLEDWKKG